MVHLSDDLAFLHRKYLVDCDVSLLFFSVELLQGLTVELNSSNNVDSIPHLRTAEQRVIHNPADLSCTQLVSFRGYVTTLHQLS